MRYFVVVLLFLSLNTQGQNAKIDSLKNILKKEIQDTVRCRILYELINEDSDDKIWPVYNRQILEIAKINLENSDGDKKRILLTYYALALSNFGYLYKQQGEISKAFDYFNQAITIQKENADKIGIASSFINLGYLCRQQGNIAKALDYYHNALKIQIEINNKPGIAISYNNIGYVYDNQGEFIKALEYYIKALYIYKDINDKNGMAICYLNMASIYNIAGDLTGIGTKYERIKTGRIKAIDYLNQSISIYEKTNDKEGLASSLNCLGKIYEEHGDPLCELTGQQYKISGQKKALECYMKALKIRDETNNKVGLSMSYSTIGEFYFARGKINEAKHYSLLCLKTAEKLGYPEQIRDAAYLLKRIYEKQNLHQQALEMFELFVQMRDSVINQENKKITYKKQFQIEYELQATKDSIANAAQIKEEQLKHEQAITKQRFYTFGGILGFIFMLIVAGVSYKAYKNKKSANLLLALQNSEIIQQKEEIITQRDEIESQRDKLGEQNILLEEKKKEITDSLNYAKQIQQAVLPNLAEIISPKLQNSNIKFQGGLELGTCLPAGEAGNLEFESFVLFKPKDIVSGDFYWATRINKWFIITLADCTGHGVPGAFMSMLGISFLNEIVRKKPVFRQDREVTKASEVLDRLRESIIEALQQKGKSGEQKDGMDIAFCAINTETLEMQFAGANNPCYVIAMAQPEAISTAQSDCFVPRNDDHYLIELKGDKMPIGIHLNMQPFTNQIYQLQKGDIIYMMSDGYEDQFGGPNRKKFLAKNLKNLLIAYCQQPMADQKQVLDKILKDWIGDNEQIDDITVVGIKFL